MRSMTLAHRYLGIALGALVVTWTGSGIVMHFVPYPRLDEAERLGGLAPIRWADRGAGLGALDRWLAARDLRVEMVGPHLVLRGEGEPAVDLATGSPLRRVEPSDAAEVAAVFRDRIGRSAPGAAAPRLIALVEDDVWTLSGVAEHERPLYRFSLDDAAGREVYVSAVSGRIVQMTTRRQRFWSWFASIPHWLYVVPLRRHVRVWSSLVVYTSLGALVLAVTGLAVGLKARGPVRGTRRRPSAAALRWHRRTGLVFGLFVVTWTASGLLSMNPWGLLEGAGFRTEQDRVRGPPLPPARVLAGLRAMANSPLAIGAISARAVPVLGELYFVLDRQDGTAVRFDDSGHEAKLSRGAVAAIAEACAGPGVPATIDLLDGTGDTYFAVGAPRAGRAIVRVVAGRADRPRYYVDAASGEIMAKVDRAARAYRWAFTGLHRFDAFAGARTTSCRTIPILGALLGVLCVAVSGFLLGARRAARALARAGTIVLSAPRPDRRRR